MLMAQNRSKKIFLSGKTTDMQEKKVENIIVHGPSVNKKFLFFCLQFSFKDNGY